MKMPPQICMLFRKQLIVSCQASEGDAFRDPVSMARFAQAAVTGGAAGIRANSPEDIRAIRQAVDVPIIGIQKQLQDDGRILITATFEAARQLVEAGAQIVALDCTARGQRYGAIERLRRIRSELGVPVMADIATAEEAHAAMVAGADLVATTMRGYTPETEHVRRFEPAFVRELVRGLNVPVVAEGRVSTPGEAAAALAAGAFAVIVGTAITRPQDITRDFALAVERERKREEQPQFLLGIDLGGTNTKFGVVAGDGRLVASSVAPTPPGGGREILLNHLKQIAAQCQNLAREAGVSATGMGVATAGWVDAETGRVAYATENLPGWTGTPIAAELRGVVDLPVAVENDANALAVAERHFGLARDVNDFVCITLGTGVGGGCYVDGRLNRGSHFFANALGHITIEMNGLPCTCGRKGCLEPYANAAALVRYAEGAFLTAEEVIHAANAGDNLALQAVRRYAGYLAVGAASIIHLLDPSMLILSGGIAQQNPNLLHDLEEELSSRITAWEQRRLQVRFSELGYFGGVLGAAGLAMQRSLSPSS